MPADTEDATRTGDAPINPASGGLVRALAARGVLRRFRKGTVLIHEGDQGDTVFVILKGRLRVYSSNDKGREITFGIYGPGEYVGEMSLDGGLRSATVESMEPSECAVVSRAALLQHISEHPEFAFELLAKVIRRARAATLGAKQLALNDVYGRLVALLNDLSSARDDGSRFIPGPLTHLELSNRLGCSREMVSRLLKDLRTGRHLVVTPSGIEWNRRLPPRW